MIGTQAHLENIVAKGLRWYSGPDPLHHRMYVQFGYHRVTSRLRGDEWDLAWEDWRDIWLPNWHRRGRKSQDLCLTRLDWEKPWSGDNIELVTRSEHSRRIRKYHQ